MYQKLIDMYKYKNTCFFSGDLLRSFAKHEKLAGQILDEPKYFFTIFEYLYDYKNIELQLDASETIRSILSIQEALKEDLKLSPIAISFLEKNYDVIFGKIMNILKKTENIDYLTQRIMAEFLLDLIKIQNGCDAYRKRFLQDVDFFKIILNMVNDDSNKIQECAFHILKYFIVNPEKSKSVEKIVNKNINVLVQYITQYPCKCDTDIQDMDYLVNFLQYMDKKIKRDNTKRNEEKMKEKKSHEMKEKKSNELKETSYTYYSYE